MPTYRDLKKILRKANGILLKQAKGSHEIWEVNGVKVTVAKHKGKEMPTGTFNKIKKIIEKSTKG